MIPILEEVWKDVTDQFGEANLERIHGMFEILSGERSPTPEPLQDVSLTQDVSVFIPGLSAKPWHSPDAFPWLQAIEQAYPLIKEEMLQAVRVKENVEPYSASYDVSGGLLGELEAPKVVDDEAWVATYFYKAFSRVDAKCERCPHTAKVLDTIGVAREALFSIMRPGAVIPPHSDRMNFVTTCHLGLTIPAETGIRVGTETRRWEEGKCLFFDSSFEHEAWNKSDRQRVVLLIDVWHPDLTPKEIQVMTYLRPHIEMVLGATPKG